MRSAAAALLLTAVASGGTLGKVVPIDGTSADIALDERRGNLYIANYPASRIDVMSVSSNSLQGPISVPLQPGSPAM